MKIKLRKQTIASLCIIMGVALLATSVFADAINKSAYEQLKDAVKSSSSQMSGQIRNYTMQSTFTLKDNDLLLLSTTSVRKVDGQKSETVEMRQTAKGTAQSSYSYTDENQNIWYDSYSDTYYVTEYSRPEFESGRPDEYGPGYSGRYDDPLAQDYVSDVERILDAFIGNLKNYVTVEQNDDGSKVFAGSLSDTEIPALVNAVASFLTKQYLVSSGAYTTEAAAPEMAVPVSNDAAYSRYDPFSEQERIPIPSLDGDVYIKSMTGQAKANPDGLLTDITASVVLSGKDPDGNRHDLTFDIRMTLDSVLTTLVAPPDLSGKNVQINTMYDHYGSTRITEKYIGTYKNDIVIETDQSFAKIGERIIIIESINEQTVVGSYSESFTEEPADMIPLTFEFTADNIDPYSLTFTYTGRHGQIINGYLYFDPASANIQFYDENEKGTGLFNPVFQRIFD